MANQLTAEIIFFGAKQIKKKWDAEQTGLINRPRTHRCSFVL
jgi:hypothetical protein